MDAPLSTRDAFAGTRTDSLADRAHKTIRADIIAGRLPPDSRLRLEDLRERCDMGFSPIREALMQLHSEGLVTLESMKGFRVAPVSLDQLRDLSRVRIEMESLAIRWSIQQGDAGWEAEILGAFHRLSKLDKYGDGDWEQADSGWRRKHREFHRTLIAGCGSPLLLATCASLYDQAERYVALSIQHTVDPRDDLAEHDAIMRAALAHDADEASRLTAEHITRTTEKVASASALFSASSTAESSGARPSRSLRGKAERTK